MHYSNRLFLVFAGLSLLFIASCKKETTPSCQTDMEAKQIRVPAFSADSAYAYIEKQLSFGARVPGTEPHRQTKDWLVRELRAFGATVSTQKVEAVGAEGKAWSGYNIIANYNPTIRQRLMLAAHWDSRFQADKDTSRKAEPIPGADDGASGVGVLLEIARQLKANPIPMGIDIVLFDLEDQGKDGEAYSNTWGLGSQYWAEQWNETSCPPRYGILLDMVGARGARFPKEGISMEIAKKEVDKIWKLAQALGKGKYFVNERGGGITDDHYFVYKGAGIPMVDIINLQPNGFGSYHHTHRDDLQVIDKATLGAVGQVVLAVIYNESNGKI